ncbi:MAG: tetratricopeptide repeat protein [Bacteroidota bacterium]|nr:tetratricopeptide repeat protein [Bacteroidota bacterium]
MNKKLYISLLTIFVAGVIGGYFLWKKGEGVTELPRLSPRAGEVRPSSEFLNAERAVDFYRDEIQRHPSVVKNYVQLAGLYIQESRVTGNHHEYLPKVKYLLEKALSLDARDFEAVVTKASLLMTLHQFQGARALAEKAIAINPYNAFAYGVLTDALVELGKYGDAVKTCDKMLSLHPDLRSYARASYLRELYGDARGAEEAMRLAADAGAAGQENRSWALYNLGTLYLSEGKVDTAEFIYNGILQERPNYAFALSGLAQVECVGKNYGEATELLVKASQMNPSHLFLQQLADIYRITGQKEAEEEVSKQILQAFKVHREDGYDTYYEYALYCSNHSIHLKEALEQAREEYEIRPDNIDALDTYAWALYKNGKSAEAVPYIEKALRLNTQRAVLHYHAAEIYHAVNQNAKALASIDRCFKENPLFDALYGSNTRTLYASLQGYASLQ